jgi:ribosomal protein S18 acetylase RimI-like enzyme
MEIHIRDGRPSDARAVTDLAGRAKSSWGYPAAWMESWRESLTLTPEYLAAHRSSVAEHGEEIVGVCVLETHGTRALLEHVWIAPEYQGRGIGRALVERALDAAASAGLERVDVQADPFAEPFYLRLGARRLGATPAPMPGAPERTLPRLEFRVGPRSRSALR